MRLSFRLPLEASLLLSVVLKGFAEEFVRIEFQINAGEYFRLYVGTPWQSNFATFDLFERDLLVIDHKCGRLRTDCPRYCQDVLFFSVFCPPACDPARSDITRTKYWGGQTNRFWAENSTTCVDERPPHKWTFRSQNYEKSTGRWVEDTLEFWANGRSSVVFVPNVRFVLVEYTDNRLFRNWIVSGDAVLGLTPGPTAFVPQLFERRLIAEATITIVPFSLSGGYAFVGQPADNSFCNNTAWTGVRPLNPTNWFLEAKSIRIGNFVFFDQLVALTPTQVLEVPDTLLSQFFEERMLFEQPGELFLTAACNSIGLDVSVEFEGAEITIFTTRLVDKERQPLTGRCSTQFASLPAARYARTAGWTVGSFLAAKCLRHDYEQHAVGVSDALAWRARK